MLAYLFWHRPFGRVDRKLYEEALLRFQRDLAAANHGSCEEDFSVCLQADQLRRNANTALGGDRLDLHNVPKFSEAFNQALFLLVG
jgi:hypothetical protein